MRTCILLTAALWVFPLFGENDGKAWPKEPDAFMDVKFGDPLTKYGLRWDCAAISRNTSVCPSTLTLTDTLTVDVKFVFSTERGLERVWLQFDTSDYEFVRDLMVLRYGPATATGSGIVENRAGAKFVNDMLEWKGELVNARLERYGVDIDTSIFTLQTHEAKRALDAEREAKLRKAATTF